MAETPAWHLEGDWFDVCKCTVPCPCTFAQAPSEGDCEGILAKRHGRAVLLSKTAAFKQRWIAQYSAAERSGGFIFERFKYALGSFLDDAANGSALMPGRHLPGHSSRGFADQDRNQLRNLQNFLHRFGRIDDFQAAA